MPGNKTRPLTWAISYEGEVKGSIITICVNPQGKGTLTGDKLRAVIEEAKKLSPTKCKVYIENNDDTYCQKWLKDNETILNEVGGAISLNKVKEIDPRWQLIKEKYLESRKGKANVQKMLENDIAEVLKTHSEWKDTAEEHIIDTAIHTAWLQTDNETPTDVTFMWYPNKLTDTILHAMKFIKDNAESFGLNPINLKHFPFDIKDLLDTQKTRQKTQQQTQALQTQAVAKEPMLVKAEPVVIPADPPSNSSYAYVIQASMAQYIRDIHEEEGKKGVAEFFSLLMAMQLPKPENKSEPLGQIHNSLSLQKLSHEDEMKVPSPPVSPLRAHSLLGRPPSHKSCRSEELPAILPSVSPPTLGITPTRR